MFGKILRAGKGGHGVKYKIDVQVTTAENLPNTVKKCRVVWARSAKVQMTDTKDVKGSIAKFKQTLTQVTTMYRDKSGKLDVKEYEFKVQDMGKGSSDTPVSIGKATVDMAIYCKDETYTQNLMLPITFKKSGGTTGYVKLQITSVFLGDATEDGQTEVSGITGRTSDHEPIHEQDLEGFVEDDHSKFSKLAKDSSSAVASTSGRNSKADGSRWHKPLPPTAEEDASDLEDEQPEEPPKTVKPSRRKSEASRQPAEDNPFAKKVSKPPVRKLPPKVYDDDDDVSPMNSDISDSEASVPATSAEAAAVGSSKGASSRAGKDSAPAPVEDEDALGNDLFNPKSRSSSVASASKAVTSKAVAGNNAAAADVHSRRKESAGYGPSTSTVPAPTAGAKARGRATDASETPAKGHAALAKAGSAKSDSVKAPLAMEMEQLRQHIAQLEQQLVDEQAAKDELSKKMQKYVDKVADLEDQLAEGDVTELYAQMKEMELRHQAEIKDMEAKYQAEIKDLMERHLAEVEESEERHQAELADLRTGSGGRGTGSASVDELKRLQADLREQEALLKSRVAKLEAEQASTTLARQAAEVKLAEANKMLDDSLLMATKHQQEKKILQEEVARLKRQLEDASMWDTCAAVAAATASAKRDRDDDDELEELRAKLQELQEENSRLQRLNEVALHAATDMLREINGLVEDPHGVDCLWESTGPTQLDQLAVSLRCLSAAFNAKSAALQEAEARLAAVPQHRSSHPGSSHLPAGATVTDGDTGGNSDDGTNGKVKPHELLSRVHQLTAERDALKEQLAVRSQAQTKLVSAQQLVTQLRQRVEEMTAEKEALERFKVATIADLRRQNDELRSSLRTLSSAGLTQGASKGEEISTGGFHTALKDAGLTNAASSPGYFGGEGNWHEFETLVAQLQSDRSELRRQVQQLEADNASLGKQLQDARSGGDAIFLRAETPVDMSEDRQRSGRHASSTQRVAELEDEVARLQAQLAELSEAEAVIKEWSDYSDGLVADRARLEEQVRVLTQQLGNSVAKDGAPGAASLGEWQGRAREAEQKAEDHAKQLQALDLRVQDLMRQMEDTSLRAQAAEQQTATAEQKAALANNRAVDAESKVVDAERRAQEAETRAQEAVAAASAVAAAAERLHNDSTQFTVAASAAAAAASPPCIRQQPADSAEVMELRREISRLEASLLGLQKELQETKSRRPSSGEGGSLLVPDLGVRHRDITARNAGPSYERGLVDGDSSADEQAVSACAEGAASASVRGWNLKMEQLRARNAALEATVAGLQASLAAVTAKMQRGGSIPEELQAQLTRALKEKAELEGTVLMLRYELERAPLVGRVSGTNESEDVNPFSRSHTDFGDREAFMPGTVMIGMAPAPDANSDVMALREQIEELQEELVEMKEERASLKATLANLRASHSRLKEENGDAEVTIRRLGTELEEVTEALEVANNEIERLSQQVLSLREQVERMEKGGSAGGSRSESVRHSSSHASEDGASVTLQESRSVAAERQLAAAWLVAQGLIHQLAGSGNGLDSTPTSIGMSNKEDLAGALEALRGHISELQKESRHQVSASRTSSNATAALNAAAVADAKDQLAKATARIDELEQLLEDAEIENQHLTEQLEECLTGGRKGPDSVGSAADECQSSYAGSAAAGATGASNQYSYGHANSLTLSAFEQRLAMAESRRDELAASLEDAISRNRRLETDISALKQELVAARRGQDHSVLGENDWGFMQAPGRSRGTARTPETEESYMKRIEELQAANRKLEAVCGDLKGKSRAAEEQAGKLLVEVEGLTRKINDLEAAAIQKRLEEAAGGPAGRQPKEQVTDLEARVARLTREKTGLEQQLADERTARQELEDTLKDKLDRAGDDEAAETVAAFEVKYNRLKERYKMLEESSQEELDELQDQLTEAVTQVNDLQRQVKQLQGQLNQSRASAGAAANVEELHNLRSENERLVQQLVSKTMELAELSEREITMKRELARVREVNMKLAQKATTLEAHVVTTQAASKPAKGGKK